MEDKDLYFDVTSIKQGAVQRLGRNSNFVLVMAALKVVLQLGSTIILTRLIPPSEFGVVAVALPVVAIGLTLSEFGLGQSVVQAPQIGHRLVSLLFWLNTMLSLTICIILFAMAAHASVFFDEPRVEAVFKWFAVSVFLNGSVSQYTAVLRRRMEVQLLEYVNLTTFVVSTVVAIIAAALGAGYWAIVVQQVLGALLTASLLVLLVPWRPSLPSRASFAGSRAFIAFGSYITIWNLVETLGKSLPVLFVGRMLTPLDAALLQRGSTLSTILPGRIIRPLGGVYVSTLSKLQDDPQIFRRVFESAVVRINLILLPFAVVLFTCSDVIVPFLFGDAWLDLAPVLGWLSLQMLQVGPERALVWSITSSGKGNYLVFYALLGLTLMIAVLALQVGKGIVVLAASIALAQQFIRLPLLMALAFKVTHLDLPTILRPTMIDASWAILAIFAVTLSQQYVGASGLFEELMVAGGIVAVAVLARVFATPSLRSDLISKTVHIIKKVKK
jgi:PST family polysaccharide transporter